MTRLELKRRIAKIWPRDYFSKKIILLYHSVGNSLLGMPKDKFRDQINWLTDHCVVVPLTELLESKPKLNDTIQVALTFDDGYQSLHDQVAPILIEKKVQATVYINTGWMGEGSEGRKLSKPELGHYPDEAFLTWQEVKALYDAKWEIGSHGVNHYNFARTSPELMYQELSQSKRDIESYLGAECLHFAYPWGRHSRQVKKAVKEIGYKYAAAACHASISPHVDLYALPRMNIETTYSIADFKNILMGKWNYLGLIHKLRGM